LVVGPISLDPLRRSVVAYGRDVTLTPESSLCSIPDGEDERAAAKSEILHAVWGSGFDGDPNIVEVYIGYLRRKIDLAPFESVIRTVRGIGYSMRSD